MISCIKDDKIVRFASEDEVVSVTETEPRFSTVTLTDGSIYKIDSIELEKLANAHR